MVDLETVPSYLSDEQIAWVGDTIAGMTPEEGIGQLLIISSQNRNPDYIRKMCESYHISGFRWMGGTLEEVYEQNRFYQECSGTPLLIATNCETSGNGAAVKEAIMATNAAYGTCETTQTAYDTGYTSGVEASTIGCNRNSAPVTDVLLNWRNTIVNTWCFGDEPDMVVRAAEAHMDGVHRHDIACCAKHLLEGGSEGRNQHLVMGHNDSSCEEWDNTYGKTYRELIDNGLESMMIGHVCQPAYTRRFQPDASDKDIMSVTLSPELLQNLLREQLGLNGLIVTDTSCMVGLACSCPRNEQVPGVIAAGYDMSLFPYEPEEDLRYMMDGYRNGVITEERSSDALHRILRMKAHLGLCHLESPDRKGLGMAGCGTHHQYTARAAEEAVTLVEDTQRILPIDPEKRKRVKLYYIKSELVNILDGTDASRHTVMEKLEKTGFEVAPHKNFYEVKRDHPSPWNKGLIRACRPVEELRARYDLTMIFVHVKGYTRGGTMRIRWSAGHSNEISWYSTDMSMVCVSSNYTNHLYELPMPRTFINAYCPTREYIHATVMKIVGKSEFRRHHNDTV